MAKEQPESGGGVPSLDPVLRIVGDYAAIARKLEEDINALSQLLQDEAECFAEDSLGYLQFSTPVRHKNAKDWEYSTIVFAGTQIIPDTEVTLRWCGSLGDYLSVTLEPGNAYQIQGIAQWANISLSEYSPLLGNDGNFYEYPPLFFDIEPSVEAVALAVYIHSGGPLPPSAGAPHPSLDFIPHELLIQVQRAIRDTSFTWDYKDIPYTFLAFLITGERSPLDFQALYDWIVERTVADPIGDPLPLGDVVGLYTGAAWFRGRNIDNWKLHSEWYIQPGDQIQPVSDGKLVFSPETGQDSIYFSAQYLYQINTSEPWNIGGISEIDISKHLFPPVRARNGFYYDSNRVVIEGQLGFSFATMVQGIAYYFATGELKDDMMNNHVLAWNESILEWIGLVGSVLTRPSDGSIFSWPNWRDVPYAWLERIFREGILDFERIRDLLPAFTYSPPDYDSNLPTEADVLNFFLQFQDCISEETASNLAKVMLTFIYADNVGSLAALLGVKSTGYIIGVGGQAGVAFGAGIVLAWDSGAFRSNFKCYVSPEWGFQAGGLFSRDFYILKFHSTADPSAFTGDAINFAPQVGPVKFLWSVSSTCDVTFAYGVDFWWDESDWSAAASLSHTTPCSEVWEALKGIINAIL